MSRCILVAELATNHGGDMTLAKEMITRAAAAGADIVKTQGYQMKHLRQSDPQYDWFTQSVLSDDQHRELIAHCGDLGVHYMSTGYTESDLRRLWRFGLRRVKIGSGEGYRLVGLALATFHEVYVSLAWGVPKESTFLNRPDPTVHVLATVPLYPAPVETYSRVSRCRGAGYSDHHIGLDVAKIAIARGATVLEKHFQIDGRGRNQPWNMNAEGLAELKRWADVCAQARDGTAFEGRWRESSSS